MRAFVIIAAVILGYFAYTAGFPSGTLRYRLTVEVMVDGDVHTGSSVIEVRYTKQRAWDNSVLAKKKGEAVLVNLGKRGLLFLTMSAPIDYKPGEYTVDAAQLPIRTFFATSVGGLDPTELRHLGKLTAEVDASKLPLMVRLPSAETAKGATRVNPTNLAEAFGPGVRLHKVIIETTDDRLAGNIEQMPFYAELREEEKKFRTHKIGDPFRVNSGMFHTEQF